jgi:hypothetical protein
LAGLCIVGSACLTAACGKLTSSLIQIPDNPKDETIAIFRIDREKQAIYSGKLHSHKFTEVCSGSYPEVSPSGRFIAYNPNGGRNPAIQPVQLIEISTAKIFAFTSIPADLLPNPGSFWSKDERRIAFKVHDFNGNREDGVVNVADGSYWRGTESEFDSRFADAFGPIVLNARQSTEGRLTIENFDHVGALYFHPENGVPIRLTPENMGVTSVPIWIERTREALFVGVHTWPPYYDEDVSEGSVYLVKPEAKDWEHASKKDWEDAIISSGEQVSCSK